MTESLIIGYGVVFDDADRVLLLRRRAHESLWPGVWWLPGDVTPLDEEPDDTVPRLFEHLLRQRVRAAYAHTVYGEEPSNGRHTVHNAYVVMVEESIDGAPDDETNPFDAMEWCDVPAAIAELPPQQAELLATVIERKQQGWSFEDDIGLDDLDDLFDEAIPTSGAKPSPPTELSPRDEALTRLAARIAASTALGRDADWERELQTAQSLGWSWPDLEQVAALAAQVAAQSEQPAQSA